METKLGQVECCGCGYRKLLLINLESNKKKTILHLVCDSCWLLQFVEVTGGVSEKVPQSIKTKPDYTG